VAAAATSLAALPGFGHDHSSGTPSWIANMVHSDSGAPGPPVRVVVEPVRQRLRPVVEVERGAVLPAAKSPLQSLSSPDSSSNRNSSQ
jgi:hypothetical protein